MTLYPLFTRSWFTPIRFSYNRLAHNLLTVLLFVIATISSMTFSSAAYSDSDTGTEPDLALAPYHLSYAATYNGMDIEASRQLYLENGHYTLTTTAENLLSNIEERGSFQLDKSGVIVDLGYKYKRSILGIKKTEKLSYDRETGIAKYKSKKKKREVTLADGYLNRLTYQVQLQRDLLKGKEPPFEYQVISRGRLKPYHFEALGEEVLDTPLGKVTATKVRRVRKDNDRETLFWFAPQWNYSLVQLWQREKGGEDYKIVLKEGTLDGKPLQLK